MKLLLAVSAVLSWLFGAMLLLAPGQFYAPAGITLTPIVATIAQSHGATLVGLGVVNWLARGAEGQGLIAVLGGNLVVQILSLIVALRTMSLGSNAIPAIVIHVVLGAFFAYFLTKSRT